MITALLTVVIVILAIVLVVLVGVIRRLQAHELILSGSMTSAGPSSVRPAGAIPDFAAVLTDGTPIDRPTLLSQPSADDDVRVVFFSTDCEHCAGTVRELGQQLDADPALAAGTLVVIFDDAENARPFLDVLDGKVRVAVRPPGDPMILAFGVSALPRVHTFRATGALRSVTTTLDEVVAARA